MSLALHNRILELERRVAELEALAKPAPEPAHHTDPAPVTPPEQSKLARLATAVGLKRA